LAEQGFFVKEMNTGWTEWNEAGLPVHADAALEPGAVRCTCSFE
jgi:hypothetical protein